MGERWVIGQNVPWNASWTGEDSYEVRNCRWVRHAPAIWSPHRPGEGRPIFAKPHMVRQRRSIAEFRCTVCGERTTPGDSWWFGLGRTDVPGWAFTTTESAVHRACADLALRICPRLRTLGVAPSPFPEPDAVLRALVGGPVTEDDYGLSLQGRVVVGHLKYAWRRLPECLRAR